MNAHLDLRELKKDETRALIHRAAIQLFLQHGYQATTISMIAQKARIAPRTFFSYYPSKKAILCAVSDEHCERLLKLAGSKDVANSTISIFKAFMITVIDAPVARYFKDADLGVYKTAFICPELLKYSGAMRAKVSVAFAQCFAQDMGCDPGDPNPKLAGEVLVTSLWLANTTPFLYVKKDNHRLLDAYFLGLDKTLKTMGEQFVALSTDL